MDRLSKRGEEYTMEEDFLEHKLEVDVNLDSLDYEKQDFDGSSKLIASADRLIRQRHHNVKHKITDLLIEKRFICYDEVYAIDSSGSTRYSDIIAFHPDNKTALIIDPTVRYETNDPDQTEKVHQENKSIYEKCIDYYEEKFRESHGDRNYSIHGL